MAAVRCPSCTSDGTLACAACKNVKYCSVECQQSDWQSHKMLCKTWKDFQQRPAENMRRVIIFHPEQKKPEFAWLPVVRDARYYPEEPVGEDVKYDHILDDDTCSYITVNPLLENLPLGYQINFGHDDNFLDKYANSNKAVIGATNGKALHDWRGPLVAYCGDAYKPLCKMVKAGDMDMKSFSELVSWLLWMGPSASRNNFLVGPKIKALRTNCRAETNARGIGYAEHVEVPRTHPIFDTSSTEISSISVRIGIPLAFRKYPQKQYTNTTAGDFDNYNVTMMMLECDPNKQSFAWAPVHWQGGQIQNVLIARTDGTPFDTQVYEIFGNYCCNFVQPKMEAMLEGEMTQEQCLGQITRESWRRWVEKNELVTFDARF